MMTYLRKTACTGLVTVALVGVSPAFADSVRVSTSDDGTTFTVLGFVEVFDTAASATAAQIYQYGTPCGVSYNNGAGLFSAQLDRTVIAVVDTSDEGRTVFVVHDAPRGAVNCPVGSDPTGGASNNNYDLSFDADGMTCAVRDDDPGNDSYTGCPGPSTSISANHQWVNTRTDGIVLGDLDGAWRLDMTYNGAPSNIFGIAVLSKDGAGTAIAFNGGPPPDTVRLDQVLDVAVDIKPGSDPNCFNINDHGVVPVAILGAADFDVTMIDLTSLNFGGLEVRVRGNGNPQCSIKDVDGDGYDDLVCQFEDDSGAWTPGDSIASLSGVLADDGDTPFYGEDAICIRPAE